MSASLHCTPTGSRVPLRFTCGRAPRNLYPPKSIAALLYSLPPFTHLLPIRMYTIGYDIGSSSVKAALVEAKTGKVLARVTAPDTEMGMDAPEAGWAEQNPEDWYKYVVQATQDILARTQVQSEDIKAVGIGYQMHGLVLVDADHKVVRPSIIWCDGRAVETGDRAFKGIGDATCLEHCLNSPGNFTAE